MPSPVHRYMPEAPEAPVGDEDEDEGDAAGKKAPAQSEKEAAMDAALRSGDSDAIEAAREGLRREAAGKAPKPLAEVRYYYNSKTKQSCWHKPPGCAVDALSSTSAPLSWVRVRVGGEATPWYIVTTDKGGRFFCNREQGKSYWAMPKEVEEAMASLYFHASKESSRRPDAEQPQPQEQQEQEQQEEEQEEEATGLYRAVAAAAVRAAFALDSDSVGVLGVGEVIEVEESRRNEAGIMRVRFEHEGQQRWTSLVARNGTVLLHKLSPEEYAQEGYAVGRGGAAAAPEQRKEAKPKLSGNEAKLKAIADFKAMLEECGVAAFGAWEKELPKFLSDPRYKALPTMAERRGLFDTFVRGKAEAERKRKAAGRKAAIEGFRELLAELGGELTAESTLATVAASKGLDPRFAALEVKDKEALLAQVRGHLHRIRLRKMC